MNPTRLAARSNGASVTAERLTDAVIAALADEQPHHLLRGTSVDVSGDEGTQRLFPSVDAAAWTVVTDRRVLFVVPEALETRTEDATYDEIESVDVEGEGLPEFEVVAGDRTVTLNAGEDEPVEAAAAFVRERTVGEDGPVAEPDLTNAVDRGSEAHLADGPQRNAEPDGDTQPDGSSTGPGGDTQPDGSSTGPGGDTQPDGSADDPLDKLERLADLHDRGVITEAELEERKQELLDRL